MHGKIVELVAVTGTRGIGTPENPHREVTVYCTQDGKIVGDSDSWKDWIFEQSYKLKDSQVWLKSINEQRRDRE